MRRMRPFLVIMLLGAMATSCGVSGDPGHCYFSLDWEYYNEDYGVYYYEDNNPDVPESEFIEPGLYYDCYPGTYDYYYESEDRDYVYTYEGFYTLVQNPGTPGGFLHDGMDGTDTYFDLYLYIYNRKGLWVDGISIDGQGATDPSSGTPSAGIQPGVMFSDGDTSAGNTPVSLPSASVNQSANSTHSLVMKSNPETVMAASPVKVNQRSWEVTRGNWTLRFEEEVKAYQK